jgi:protein-S-isoprenylcysteine O-methyltransferase Ste14
MSAGAPARRLVPPVYFLAAVLTMAGLHALLPLARLVPPPWHLLGLIGPVLGAVVALDSARRFFRAGTEVRPFREPAVLVTSGWYRYSRNPMYLGMVLTLAGVAVLLGTLSPWLVVGLFPVVMERQFIAGEERMLERRFGRAYAEYRSRVRRWL